MAAPEAIPPTTTRTLPALTAANREFWTGGAAGKLLVPRCRACRRWTLPPKVECPACGGQTVPAPVSGRATLLTWTTNSHQFHPEIPPPYVIAIVTLEEQEDLRLVTNLVGCTEDDLSAGMPLEVRFECHGEIFYPVFGPAGQP